LRHCYAIIAIIYIAIISADATHDTLSFAGFSAPLRHCDITVTDSFSPDFSFRHDAGQIVRQPQPFIVSIRELSHWLHFLHFRAFATPRLQAFFAAADAMFIAPLAADVSWRRLAEMLPPPRGNIFASWHFIADTLLRFIIIAADAAVLAAGAGHYAAIFQ
jgi:hypothetical protein